MLHGAHAQRIRLPVFRSFVGALDGQAPDIVLGYLLESLFFAGV